VSVSSPQIGITTKDACVDFPIFDAKSRSLKKTVMGVVGGHIASESKVPIIEALRDVTLRLTS
jgi:ABC-2 type transport system ATP-binding protein